MKKVNALIIIGILVIVVCMLYLQQTGVSLRIARLIKPTIVKEQSLYISNSVVKRLFPSFQSHRIVLVGLPPNQGGILFLENLSKSYEATLKRKPEIIMDLENLLECQRDCWVPLPPEGAHSLKENPLIINMIDPLGIPYFSLTVVPFNRDQKVAVECNDQKRLIFSCLVSLSIRAAKKKFKTESGYFFLNRYNDKDNFLFIENRHYK